MPRMLGVISWVPLKCAICLTFVNHIQPTMKHNHCHMLTRARTDRKGQMMNLNLYRMLNVKSFSFLIF